MWFSTFPYTTIILLVILWAFPAQAATYYLSPTGNDSAACTQAAPCLTIARGTSVMSGCDTLYLRQGTYANQTIWTAPSCNSGGYTLIASFPAETATLTKNVACIGSDHHIQFDRLDLNIINEGYGGSGFGQGETSHHCKFTNGEIRNGTANSITGVQGGGANHEISNSRIHHIHSPSNCNNNNSDACYGMYVWWADSLIANNEIYSNDGYALHLYGCLLYTSDAADERS